jgi:DNA helicase II / ATP-dependent DNA helicase PcrA
MGDRMIPLTAEQQIAVDHPDTLALTSCPGSGKTRTIIVKLQKCIDEIRDTPRRIACITFTNSGVDEIESRLREFSTHDDNELCEVSTIHSFCLNNILRPFSHLVPHLQGEWSIVTDDDDWFIELVRDLRSKYDITARDAEQFSGLRRTFPNGDPSKNTLPPAAVTEFLMRIDEARRVTLNDIVYFAARLVEEHEFIASALAARFAWFIVDEFQDTTVAQAIMLLKIFRQVRTKLFFVGDPNQSILSVAGAKPGLMAAFAKEVDARTDCKLTGNFRCSQLIIDKAELLCPSDPKMIAVGATKAFHIAPIHQHCASAVEAVLDYFIPALDDLGIEHGEAAVLAPWWRDLLDIGRALRSRQIGVIGPGSRPYKKSNDFAMLSEALAAFLGSGDPQAAATVQKALFVTLSNVTETARWMLYQYHGKRIVFRLINHARQVLEEHEGAVDWLRKTAEGCEAILSEEELLPESKRRVFVTGANAMIADMVRNGVDIANVPAVDLGIVASPKNCISLLSMHKSKGREFDAVAVINLHDDKVPFYRCKNDEERDEYRRLLYVAATRARKLLMLFTDHSDHRNTPSRYLGSGYLGMC